MMPDSFLVKSCRLPNCFGVFFLCLFIS